MYVYFYHQLNDMGLFLVTKIILRHGLVPRDARCFRDMESPTFCVLCTSLGNLVDEANICIRTWAKIMVALVAK